MLFCFIFALNQNKDIMRYFNRFVILFLWLGLSHCSQKKAIQKIAIFDYVAPKSSYFVKINKPDVLRHQMPVVVDYYLSDTDKAYLNRLPFTYPFGINIFQNNSKLKGFIAVGKLPETDTLFNGQVSNYEQMDIKQGVYNKKSYFAVQIDDVYLVSNRKLLLENAIRTRNEWKNTAQNQLFNKGIRSLDNRADSNILIHLSELKPDVFTGTALKIQPEDTGVWQFLDWVSVEKPVVSGLNLATDSLNILKTVFGDSKPVASSFDKYVPFAATQSLALSFDDFAVFLNGLHQTGKFAPVSNQTNMPRLNSLQGICYFVENNNKSVILYLQNPDDFIDDEVEKIDEFNNFDIYSESQPELLPQYFSTLLPVPDLNFFSMNGNYVILTQTKTYLEKILNDIQNHATLFDSPTYAKLRSEIPGNYHLMLFRNRLKTGGNAYMKAQTYLVDDEVFTNMVLTPYNRSQHDVLITQVMSYSLKEVPHTDPQLVYNHKTKTYNIIYQDEENKLVLLDLKGNILWKTPLKDRIIGKIKQVDLLRNRKLQYTFVTPHHWYVIDRLGRHVEGFPQHFMQKITQGLSVFDYEHNRKYRFGITQGKKFRLFDNKGKKVKGFKVKTKADITCEPKHFRIGSKDFIVMQDSEGKLYLLNRRGAVRVKVNRSFKTTRNTWGVYNQKFVNIDDDDNLTAIALSGKVKQASMYLGTEIRSQIKYGVLAAVSGNKILINKQLNSLDLGSYTRPQIYKTRKNKYVFVADEDNNKIYAFDQHGKLLDKFPIIGHQILDFKSGKDGKYLLVYDSARNLILYKF